MVDYISGKLVEKSPAKAVIDANGIGFELLIPVSTYDHIPSLNSAVVLKSYLHVREDIMQLYGFLTDAERKLFLLLINNVSGVGPKLAIAILSSMSITSFCAAIVNDNVKALSRINGIGKRSAERLIVELRDKIHDLAPAGSLTSPVADLTPDGVKAMDDAVSGLMTLGFKADAAQRCVSKLVSDTPTDELRAENLIRQALVTLKS